MLRYGSRCGAVLRAGERACAVCREALMAELERLADDEISLPMAKAEVPRFLSAEQSLPPWLRRTVRGQS